MHFLQDTVRPVSQLDPQAPQETVDFGFTVGININYLEVISIH